MKILRIAAIAVSIACLPMAAAIGVEIVKYSNVLGTFCPLMSDAVKPGSKPGAKSSRDKCKMVVGVGMETGGVANDVEKFKDKDLPIVTKKGEELITRLKCMDKGKMGSAECKALGCTSENACIALILKNTKDLLEPVMTTLVAGQTPEAKQRSETEKKMYYDSGALYKLASLSVIPAAKRTKAMTDIATFTERINSSLDYMNVLALLLAPQAFIAASPELTPEKKAELAKVEPVAVEMEIPTENLDLADL